MTSYSYFETDGEFSLFLYKPAWRTQRCKYGVFYNKITGETTNYEAVDYWIFFDSQGELLPSPIKTEEWEWRYE